MINYIFIINYFLCCMKLFYYCIIIYILYKIVFYIIVNCFIMYEKKWNIQFWMILKKNFFTVAILAQGFWSSHLPLVFQPWDPHVATSRAQVWRRTHATGGRCLKRRSASFSKTTRPSLSMDTRPISTELSWTAPEPLRTFSSLHSRTSTPLLQTRSRSIGPLVHGPHKRETWWCPGAETRRSTSGSSLLRFLMTWKSGQEP